MRKKVAISVVAAVVVLNSFFSTTIIATTYSKTAEGNTITFVSEENEIVETESNSTVLTSEQEEQELISQTVEKTSNTTSSTPKIQSSTSINPITEVSVSTESDLRSALASGDTKVILQQDIILSTPLLITEDNTVINGNGKKIILNNTSEKETANRFVIKKRDSNSPTKVKNVVLQNITFEGYYLNAISLSSAENVFIEDVTLIGQDISNSNDKRSNVGIDLDQSTATISNLVSMNHRYAGIRLRNESEITLDGFSEHINETNDIDSQVKSGQTENILNGVNTNYTEWQVKPGTDSTPTSTIYKVKTKREVSNITEFKEAIAIPNTTVVLQDNLVINESIDIKSRNITIDGNSHQIKIISNASSNNGMNTSGLAVKSENSVIKNITIKNETTKPGLTLYTAKNAKMMDVTIIGIESNEQGKKNRSGVALDIYNTSVELTNINCTYSFYRDIQVRNGSEVNILSKNTHSKGAVHIQSIQKANEEKNIITDSSNFYLAGVAFEENGDTKVDYFLKVEKEANTVQDILENMTTGGTVIKLKNDITLDWDDFEGLPEDTESINIEIGRNVTIDGDGHTLDLNALGIFVLKGKDIIVKNITIDNSFEHGVNIYNSKNVLLDNVVVSNAIQNGIFVNGSTVVLRNVSTLHSVDEGIKITRSRTLSSSSHFNSEVKVEGTLTQKEANISVNVLNLEMLDGTKQNNKFIPQEGTYIHHENDENFKKLSQYYIDLFEIAGKPEAEKAYWEQEHDYLVLQGQLNVTNQQIVIDEDGKPIQLVGDGVTDNTENLIKLNCRIK